VPNLAHQLLAHLRGQTQEMADLLLRLARLESPSLDAAAQEPVLSLLTAELETAGLRVRRLLGRQTGGQLWAVPRERLRGRGAPAQLLLGHCDTVWPRGTVETMPVGIVDGRLTGPGVYDMKGGLVQGIFALKALRDLDLVPEVTPAVFIDSDEEIGSLESIPRLEWVARRMRRVFVLEPSLGPEGKLKTRRKGSLRFTIHITGRAAHSGLDPEKGASAILELARVIERLYALADPERGITVNVGVVSGGTRENVVAAHAEALIDVRVARRDDCAYVEEQLHDVGPLVTVTGRWTRPPLEPSAGSAVLFAQARELGRALGLDLTEAAISPGGSDGNLIGALGVPVLDGLGAEGDGAHAVDEHVLVASLPIRSHLLAEILRSPGL